jgi:hypothetical protein
MDTYPSKAASDADKALLIRLLVGLDATPSTLRLDACRLWTLRGRYGYASTSGDGETFLLTFGCRSPQAWTWSKKRLLVRPELAVVTQDGDDEGVFRLCRLPTPGAAEEIRSLVGLRKRTTWADPEAARARGYRLAERRTSQTSGGELSEISGKSGSPEGEGRTSPDGRFSSQHRPLLQEPLMPGPDFFAATEPAWTALAFTRDLEAGSQEPIAPGGVKP